MNIQERIMALHANDMYVPLSCPPFDIWLGLHTFIYQFIDKNIWSNTNWSSGLLIICVYCASHSVGFVLGKDHLQPLLCFVGQAASQWRIIGIALTFDNNMLDTIQEKNTGKPMDCFTDMLSRWLKWAPPKHDLPTLKILADALRADTVGEERMAYELELGFLKKLNSWCTSSTYKCSLLQSACFIVSSVFYLISTPSLNVEIINYCSTILHFLSCLCSSLVCQHDTYMHVLLLILYRGLARRALGHCHLNFCYKQFRMWRA